LAEPRVYNQFRKRQKGDQHCQLSRFALARAAFVGGQPIDELPSSLVELDVQA